MRRRGIYLVVLLEFLPGCAEEEPESCLPYVSIVATPPQLVSGDMLRLTVDVRDFELVEPGDPAPAGLGEHCAGHYKVHLDSSEKPALQSSIEEELIFPVEAEPGPHDLIVRLYDPDDVPLLPEVSDSVELAFQ